MITLSVSLEGQRRLVLLNALEHRYRQVTCLPLLTQLVPLTSAKRILLSSFLSCLSVTQMPSSTDITRCEEPNKKEQMLQFFSCSSGSLFTYRHCFWDRRPLLSRGVQHGACLRLCNSVCHELGHQREFSYLLYSRDFGDAVVRFRAEERHCRSQYTTLRCVTSQEPNATSTSGASVKPIGRHKKKKKKTAPPEHHCKQMCSADLPLLCSPSCLFGPQLNSFARKSTSKQQQSVNISPRSARAPCSPKTCTTWFTHVLTASCLSVDPTQTINLGTQLPFLLVFSSLPSPPPLYLNSKHAAPSLSSIAPSPFPFTPPSSLKLCSAGHHLPPTATTKKQESTPKKRLKKGSPERSNTPSNRLVGLQDLVVCFPTLLKPFLVLFKKERAQKQPTHTSRQLRLYFLSAVAQKPLLPTGKRLSRLFFFSSSCSRPVATMFFNS
jgi:hypothetical protein